LAYSPDGSLLAIGSGQVLIRDANTGKVQGRVSGPYPVVYALAFDPAGGRLAYGDLAGNVILWDLATSRLVHKFTTGSNVYSIVFLDRPRSLVTHGGSALLLFNVETGKLERKVDLAGGGIRKFVADRQRGRLVVGFESGAIESVSLPDLTPGPRLEKAHEGSVACLALSPDGRLLATASDNRVVLRDATSFETLLRFPLWDGTVRDLTFDSKGRRLAVVGTGSDVDLWDLNALRDGLTEVGLAWDRPAPAVLSTTRPATEVEQHLPAVRIIPAPRELATLLANKSAANPKDTLLSLKVAALQTWFGEEKELAATSQRMLKWAKDATKPEDLERVAKLTCLRRIADAAMRKETLALARKALEVGRKDTNFLPWAQMTLGMAEYRAGNDTAAEAAFLAALKAGPNNPHVAGISAFYRAMILFRQNKPEEARKLAIAATAQMKPLPDDEQNPLAGNATHDDLILWLAWKEAKTLLKLETVPAEPPKN
jgi:Flp pilus assembly protein TadD